jgi:hypothetical protein
MLAWAAIVTLLLPLDWYNTLMAKAKAESNSVFFLKVVFFFIVGTIWIRFDAERSGGVGIPIGFLLGLVFAAHEHFQIDQKIEYALLFIAAVLSYLLPLAPSFSSK